MSIHSKARCHVDAIRGVSNLINGEADINLEYSRKIDV